MKKYLFLEDRKDFWKNLIAVLIMSLGILTFVYLVFADIDRDMDRQCSNCSIENKTLCENYWKYRGICEVENGGDK